MQSFPSGVVSSDGRVGFVHFAGKELVAVDLVTGSILWRQQASGRPVAATDRHLIVLDIEPRPTLSVHDLTSGTLRMTIDDAALPEWAAHLRDRPEAFHFSAHEKGDVLEIGWQARALYTGGAPPRGVEQERQGSTGRLSINLGTGKKITSQIEDLQHDPLADDAHSENLAAARTLPGEVARGQAGGHHYVLRIESQTSGRQTAKLDALSPGGDEILWETELGDVEPMQRPGPLRK